jgi:hypothetical protein
LKVKQQTSTSEKIKMSFIQLCNNTKHYFKNKHGFSSFTPNIEVIASALCFVNRYNGHAGAYSVAQHSIHVHQQIKFLFPNDYRLQMAALLHDAPEAYLGDITSPLKSLLPDYKEIESHYHKVIDKYYGIETKDPRIKEVDLKILATEAKSFRLDIVSDELQSRNVLPYHFEINRDKPDLVYQAFMGTYNYLSEKRYG